ncbi:MAG: DNRLRE domain-containing protein [Nanoarchaeota archaeon]|nr:DNRLRE domain-containing protein [Nanoarchaeota archaeon]
MAKHLFTAQQSHGERMKYVFPFSLLSVFLFCQMALSDITLTFQNGIDGYSGTVDTTLVCGGGGCTDQVEFVCIDRNEHGLLQFSGIFGATPGRIPRGSAIVKATLSITVFADDVANGTTGLHRILQQWGAADNCASWGVSPHNAQVDVQADDIEAKSNPDVELSIPLGNQILQIDVTSSVQSWSSGELNNGWAFLQTSSDGWDFVSSRSSNIADRPSLEVIFTPREPQTHTVPSLQFATIQQAIDSSFGGDQIIVAPGAYNELIDFLGKAILLRSSEGPESTILDGSGLGQSVIKCSNSEGNGTAIEGFTITGGSGTPAVLAVPCGGGIFNSGASPTIRNCVFQSNMIDTGVGGGICNINNSSPLIIGCTFINNSASNGAAIFNRTSSPRIVNSRFDSNSSSNDAGAVWNENSSPWIFSCTFIMNTAGSDGGAIRNMEFSTPILMNCVFCSNEASRNGGAIINEMSTSAIVNCTFSKNRASSGGAIYDWMGSTTSLSNSILWGNIAVTYNELYPPDTAQVNYSAVQGGTLGSGNTVQDPNFLDAENCDLRITDTSPCIDAGDNTAIPMDQLDLNGDGSLEERTPWDIEGNPRFTDCTLTLDSGLTAPDYAIVVDMGAYEKKVATPSNMQKPGDCNQDLRFDISDAVCILGHLFLGFPTELPCDSAEARDTLLNANGDTGINLSDAVYILLYFFRGGPPHVQGMNCINIEGCTSLCI